jgi:hypothetical protein
VDIWVDRDGVVRKLATVLEYNQPSGDFVRMELTEEYSDFGVETNIKPPPAGQVLDVTPHLRDRGGEVKSQAA